MTIHFKPQFSVTASIKKKLRFIEEVKQSSASSPFTEAQKRKSLRLGRKIETHFFKYMEELSPDKHELNGYLAAYDALIKWADASTPITELLIKKLHGQIMNARRATPYRKGQCGVLDPTRKHVLYLPPKACDVAPLMQELVRWIATSKYPPPITAAIAHFGINSIHPYYDGNGRTSRLLTKLILRQAGYDVHGLLCLEDFYFKDINNYYEGLTIKDSTDYYSGRAIFPITSWLEYFCEGLVYSTKQALKRLS